MILTVKERLTFNQIMPEKGKLDEMTFKREILEKVQFNSDELEAIEFKQLENGNVSWEQEKAEDKEVEFKPKELVFLESQVQRLDSESGITDHLYSLCKKIKEAV